MMQRVITQSPGNLQSQSEFEFQNARGPPGDAQSVGFGFRAGVLQFVTVCCSVLQCVAVCCSVLKYGVLPSRALHRVYLQARQLLARVCVCV